MIIHLSDRRVARVHGQDARAFLNGLLTTDIAAVTDEAPQWAGLLTAQGKLIADMIVWNGGTGGDGREEILLDMHEDRLDNALAALRRYRLRRPLDIEQVQQRVFAGWDEPLVVSPYDPRSQTLGRRWLGATAHVTGDLEDYHARRIALGVPDSPDFEAGKTMWLETNADLLGGVSFTKGCFVGQENTARMNYRGKVRKRVVPVTLTSDPGDDHAITTGDGKAAGTLMSYAETADGWRGMAHLRLEHAHLPLLVGAQAASAEWPEWMPRPDDAQDAAQDAARNETDAAIAKEESA